MPLPCLGALLDGLNRYGYVHGNPTTYTDPSGNCPWCVTMAVGALIGGAVGAAVSIGTQVASGKSVSQIDWGQVGKEAAIGAVAGAVTGLAGPAAGAAASAGLRMAIGGGIGAAVGVAEQASLNWAQGKPLNEGLLEAGVIGGISGALSVPGAGKALAGLAKRGLQQMGK